MVLAALVFAGRKLSSRHPEPQQIFVHFSGKPATSFEARAEGDRCEKRERPIGSWQ